MALNSICPKCSGSSFEMAETPVKGSKFRLSFVRCASCGCVVGVQDFYNIGSLIHELAEKLNAKLD